MFEDCTVGFIGGGNMGEALIKGLLSASILSARHIRVFDVSSTRMEYLGSTFGILKSPSLAELATQSHIILLAVKPQTISIVLRELSSNLEHHPLVISIAAGVAIETFSSGLPQGTAVIRVMPNTPALVLEGASALARGPNVTDFQMQQALSLFQAVGKAMEVEEKWMDAVTALTGCGPAYVLLFLEGLIDAGVLMGLPRAVARELAVQTALGTTKMLSESGKHPAELKDLITSPGGTTIRGLQILEDRGVRGALMGAVEAAALRSRELGKN